jgi:pyruvate/2-oxoglutarate dehydrogenase complex dihydrolipoamide dehydrogenase (E3) component
VMFDVIVIGGGPAGVTAALRARSLGASVCLVERGNLGGTCTNDGCVPTRVLARTARLMRDAEQYASYALAGDRPTLDFPLLLRRTQEFVYRVHEKKQLRSHLEDAGVTVLANTGEARFTGADTLLVGTGGDEQALHANKFIVYAGGHARHLPFPGSEHALTHSDVWSMKRLPASMAIIGGAATGCQLASVFSSFGSRVSLVEVMPRLLGAEDSSVSEAIEEAFSRRGIEVLAGIGGIERIEQAGDMFTLVYQQGGETKTLSVETVLLAVGWPGNLESLNLPAAGVETARGYITVDDTLRTSAPNIYAAGDITGRMMLVQSATGEGTVAAENAVLGVERPYTHRIVPHGGFTDPEYASVGLTEEQARTQHDCAIASVPFTDLDRAIIDRRTDGFCKLIVNRGTRQIVGAHVVGEEAVEIVQIAAAGMAAAMKVEQLASLELSYPTFTAIVGLAARQILAEMDEPVSAGAEVLRRPRAGEWERTEG